MAVQQMTKSQLIEKIAADNELAKKDVKGVLETLATIGYKELKKNRCLPGSWICQVRRYQEARHQGTRRYKPFQRRADDVQGQTGSKNRQSTRRSRQQKTRL